MLKRDIAARLVRLSERIMERFDGQPEYEAGHELAAAADEALKVAGELADAKEPSPPRPAPVKKVEPA